MIILLHMNGVLDIQNSLEYESKMSYFATENQICYSHYEKTWLSSIFADYGIFISIPICMADFDNSDWWLIL